MVATNMFSLDGATHQNPAALLSYRATIQINAGASTTFVHNLGQAQTRAFSTNELLVHIRQQHSVRTSKRVFYRVLDANRLKIRNSTLTNLTIQIKVLAIHSMWH